MISTCENYDAEIRTQNEPEGSLYKATGFVYKL